MTANITPSLVSLAVLKVNWDARRKDYVDNFVPIIAECIRLGAHDVVSLPELQQEIRTRFGLRVPQHQLRAVLSRVAKQGFIRSENRAYVRVPERLSELKFGDVHQTVMARHEQILTSLVAFARDRHSVEWTGDDAELALYSYLATYQLLDPENVVSDATESSEAKIKGGQYVVGAFVTDLQVRKDSQFEYLETIAKGDILATAIFLPDPNRTAQRFRKTFVYFDTSVLIYALGHAGEARQAPCAELLHLLFEAGAELRCFAHTLDEVRASLIACAYRMESNQLADAYGPSIEYFIELASLQRLPQLHTAITENRKSNNPVILGFQGRSQLETRYGHDAEAMLSQPATKIFLRTSEPRAAKWIADTIGDIEIERLRESRSSGPGKPQSYGLERQVEPLVMASEISGLAALHGYLKLGNLVVRLHVPFIELPNRQPAFRERPPPRSQPTAVPIDVPPQSDLPSHQLVPSEVARGRDASGSTSGPAQEPFFR